MKINKRKKKVFFILNAIYGGGAERVFSYILDNLDRSKIKPICLFYNSWHFYNPSGGTKVFTLNKLELGNQFERRKRIARIIDKEEVDIVLSFAKHVNTDVLLARQFSKRSPKLIITEHTTPSISPETYKEIDDIIAERSLATRYKPFRCSKNDRHVSFVSGKKKKNMIGSLIRKLYRKADTVVAVSKGVKLDLINNFGVPTRKIRVIYNGVDTKKIKHYAREQIREHPWFQEEVPIIINVVSSFRIQKNQERLLKTFKIVRDKFYCRLVILGFGERLESLKNTTIELGIQDDVAFLGFQSNPFKFMAKSSIFVLSSKCEGFPNVILEAMACGVPVVSTNCPSGPNEIIKDKVNGILVPLKDERKLAKAILSLLKDKNLSKKISSNAKKTVKKFSVRNMTEEYSRLFREYS